MKNRFLIFAMFCFTILVSCEDDTPTVDVPPDPPKITASSTWQFSMKIDGTTFSAKDSVNGYSGSYSTSGLVAAFPDTSALIYESGLSDSSNINSLHIIKGTLHFASGMNPVDSIFESFFTPASYSYSPNSVDGIVIKWYDTNGELWSSDNGTAIQSGSTFVIKETLSSHVNGYLDVKLKATFNCKLYNSSGQSKTLTNGVYVGSFEAI